MIFVAVSTFLLFSSTNFQPPPTAPQSPPNVVIIVSDDQGWGDLSLHGNSNLQTPNIDQLAAEGVAFDRFYVSPVCSPTRAELLTGRYAARGGVYSTSAGGERLDLDETTLADAFQQAGYQTACYGKWHNGMQYPYHPNARGFDDFYGFCSGHWGNYFSPMLERNGEIVQGEGFIVDDLTDKAIQFVQDNRDQPFLLYLPYNTPHSPMQVPDRWWNRQENKTLDSLYQDPTLEEVPFTKAALAMCENIDWNVGRLLQTLADLDLAENTIVLYMSDNGPASWRWNGGMKGKKGSTDEGGVRSPLLIRWPGTLKAGTTVEEIASAMDIFPTLVELTGITAQEHQPWDGSSLKPLLLDRSSNWPDRTLIHHWRESTSVRTQQYRLDEAGRLFDIQADPGQHTDVAAQYPAVVQQLTAARQAWEADALAELPANDTRLIPVGHPDFQNTQLPARDGVAHGTIERSNQYPNCSFFTHWTAPQDSITWDIEVLAEGDFEVELYYTCSAENVGSTVMLRFQDTTHAFVMDTAHDSPLLGAEHDRYPRIESYVQDWRAMNTGIMHLHQGKGTLSLYAPRIPGEEVMDFRMLMLKRQ